MTLNPPQNFRSVDKTHRSGTIANRPAATDVLIGTLYFATDTGTLERSNGTTWDSYSSNSLSGLSLLSTGSAAIIGQLTLVAGTKTINTTAAKSTARIFFQRVSSGGTIGFATTYTIVDGVSFTVSSDSVLDTSVYNWLIIDTH